jgi:hypothetical protein
MNQTQSFVAYNISTSLAKANIGLNEKEGKELQSKWNLNKKEE